jgi:hypothetical protein
MGETRPKADLHPPRGSFQSGTIITAPMTSIASGSSTTGAGISRMTKLAICDLSALDHVKAGAQNVPIACQVRYSPTRA